MTGSGASRSLSRRSQGRPAEAGTSSARRTTAVTVPAVGDLERARHEALLQLRLGRQGLYLGLVMGALLLLDALLSLALETTPYLAGPGHRLGILFPLVIPILGALGLSLVIFLEKWGPYGYWPFEAHFSLSLISLILSGLLSGLLLLSLIHVGPPLLTAFTPGIYPVSLLAVGLPLAALALTWRGWPTRKVASILSALLPVGLFWLFYAILLAPFNVNFVLFASFSSSAFLTIAAGALLLLMASGTRAHQREVVAGGHEKLFQISEDLSRRAEVLTFREEALARREADVEAQASALQDQAASLAERRRELEALDTHLRERARTLLEKERALIPKAAEVAAAMESLRSREEQLRSRQQDLEISLAQLGERERQLLSREQTVREQEVEINARSTEVQKWSLELQQQRETLQRKLKETEARLREAQEREADARALVAVQALTSGPPGDLVARERELARQKAELERQAQQLREETSELQGSRATLEKEKEQIRQGRQEVDERRKALVAREAAVTAREREIQAQTALWKSAADRHEAEIQRLQEAVRRAQTAESQASLGLRELEGREAALKEHETRVREQEQRLQDRLETLRQREKELETQWGILRARERSALGKETVERGLRGPWRGPETGVGPLPGRAAAPPAPETAPQKIRSGDSNPKDEGTRPEETAKVTWGIPRLDELLGGGLPPRSHVALIGPPYTGKEVAIHAFLAEGLRRGEKAIVLAASRPPSELAPDLGIHLPNLPEYEGAGHLVWIGATRPDATPLGPAEQTAILQRIREALRKWEGLPVSIRFGCLSLSALFIASDENRSLAFLQNLVGMLKLHNVTALYSVDRGLHTDRQLEAIQTRMDGSLLFRSEEGKNSLSVVGLESVKSRSWIEYRFTQRGLSLGSFSLERIR
jgi:KaiC/GvpD/RAD55 family RecA-like ATPase